MSKFVQNCGFGHRKLTQETHSGEIWPFRRVNVDLGSALAHQIWPSSVKVVGTGKESPKYLILDDVGLSKQKLLYAPLCTTIQTVLEVVYRTGRNHSTFTFFFSHGN